MILTIQGPKDSISTTIYSNDIVRVETCILTFFGKKLFNLYIIIGADSDENFYLLSYASNDSFKAAFLQLSGILQGRSSGIDTIQIEPSPHIGPMAERVNLQPAF